MKVAVIYNRDSRNVINLFGVPSREKYGLRSIRRIVEALRKGGHQVLSLEGDKDLIRRLEEFMPRVLSGERPGIAFNLSYGIQGQARYTHVPGILEMAGIPYVGSGPLAHSLALDKVVSKMLFRQHGVPTPDFAVLSSPGFETPRLAFPLIVKPRNESTSMGLRICRDPDELRQAAGDIFERFGSSVLAEQFIEGREINVGLLGNRPPEVFEPAELLFGDGPPIYRYEDKVHTSGRDVAVRCPADLDGDTVRAARDVSLQAFEVLGCADCARVDLRLDAQGRLHVLEVNSLPSLGEHGSYTQAAEAAGLDFPALVNRLVEVAASRYFGTPHPPRLSRKASSSRDLTFRYLTERRDRMERRLASWVDLPSRTQDPIGIARAFQEFGQRCSQAGLQPAEGVGADRVARLWQTGTGFENGTLLLVPLDVPIGSDYRGAPFQKEPEWLLGEGVGVSRAALVQVEFALRAVKDQKNFRRRPIGVYAYADEGRDCASSAPYLREACGRARCVLVLGPGPSSGRLVVGRRGYRKYRLEVEGPPRRLGEGGKGGEVLPWTAERVVALSALTQRKARVAVSVSDMRTYAYPSLLPHRVSCSVLVSYPTGRSADEVEDRIRSTLDGKGMHWALEKLSHRPAFRKSAGNVELAEGFADIGRHWGIEVEHDTSGLPSAAGLVPEEVPALCGLGPRARNLHTPAEAVHRLSLVERTLLLAQFLLERA